FSLIGQRRCLPEGDRLGSAVKAAGAKQKDKRKTKRLDGGGRSAGKLEEQRREPLSQAHNA
ncbi:MAG: hypothetical protein K2X27_01110, partial [Candidatus Obscuribacterales bacterium]|nr:hypothetical protein [Candidatus Obscuribacterales bacterium]